MEAILKEINGVIGVTGSFVCLSDGSIAARALPDSFDAARVALAARVASQTFHALDTSGLRVAEADLTFGQGRLLLKNLRGGILVILCARNINLPLLNLTANVAVKKLTAELKPAKPPAATPAEKPTPPPAAPPVIETPVLTPVDAAISALYVEFEKEAQRILHAARENQLQLVVMDPVALWLCCTGTRHLLSQPQKRRITFAAAAGQAAQFGTLFDRLGYQPNQRFNSVYGTRQLYFHNPLRMIGVNVFLDAFQMYHRLDLRGVLARGENILPVTEVVLTRLQIVDPIEPALNDLCALFIEYGLSLTPGEHAIDMRQISQLCADDWGWYKTVTLNLDRMTQYAQAHLLPIHQQKIERQARQLRSTIEATPKSLRWQARAPLGESIRWYETPIEIGVLTRPDMAIG